MTDGKNAFDQPTKNDQRTYNNVRKFATDQGSNCITTDQGSNCITGCLLHYVYFKKMIAIDLSKQQALDVDSKSIQQINFTRNLGRIGNTTMFFDIEGAKESILHFLQGINC